MSQKHHVNYLVIFIALCVCTTLSVIFDVVDIKSKIVLVVLVMAVACAKALFVMAFFMHLKFEGKWKYILLAPTTILAIGLPLAILPDIGMHYYTVVNPQQSIHAAKHPVGDDHPQEATPAKKHH